MTTTKTDPFTHLSLEISEELGFTLEEFLDKLDECTDTIKKALNIDENCITVKFKQGAFVIEGNTPEKRTFKVEEKYKIVLNDMQSLDGMLSAVNVGKKRLIDVGCDEGSILVQFSAVGEPTVYLTGFRDENAYDVQIRKSKEKEESFEMLKQVEEKENEEMGKLEAEFENPWRVYNTDAEIELIDGLNDPSKKERAFLVKSKHHGHTPKRAKFVWNYFHMGFVADGSGVPIKDVLEFKLSSYQVENDQT